MWKKISKNIESHLKKLEIQNLVEGTLKINFSGISYDHHVYSTKKIKECLDMFLSFGITTDHLMLNDVYEINIIIYNCEQSITLYFKTDSTLLNTEIISQKYFYFINSFIKCKNIKIYKPHSCDDLINWINTFASKDNHNVLNANILSLLHDIVNNCKDYINDIKMYKSYDSLDCLKTTTEYQGCHLNFNTSSCSSVLQLQNVQKSLHILSQTLSGDSADLYKLDRLYDMKIFSHSNIKWISFDKESPSGRLYLNIHYEKFL